MSATGARRIATDAAIERGTGLYIPQSGTGGGGEWGALISNIDRTYAILRTPVGHRVVFTLALDIWDKWFELELEGEHKPEENQAFNDKVQKELARLKVKRELNRMSIFERGYGWSILAISYESTKDHSLPYEPLEAKKPEDKGYKDIVDLRAYGGDSITSVLEDRKTDSPRYGFPTEYRITAAGLTKRLRIHYTRAIHVATRLLRHDWRGISILDALWNDLVLLDNIRWSMGQTMYRYGSGFPDLEFTGADLAKIREWEESEGVRNLFARSMFVHNEKQKLEFKGVAGVALNPMNYYLPIMESISMATSIPLAILRGAQAGALTGSEVNEREYQGLLSEEQVMYEQAIRDLIILILRQPSMQGTEEGKTGDQEAEDFPAFTFKWLSGIELSETEKVDLNLKKANLLAVKGQWHTRNELRKMEDPQAKDLPEGQGGEEILGYTAPGDEEYRVTRKGPRRSESS